MVTRSPNRRVNLQRMIDLKLAANERRTREAYQSRLSREGKCLLLEQATGISDSSLLARLADAGLDEESVLALPLLPVALVAWASGEVTSQEARAADEILFDRSIQDIDSAVSLFQSWLKQKPDKDWIRLWSDYTLRRAVVIGDRLHQTIGRTIHEAGTRVALASGGVFGFGAICAEEANVLNWIRTAHACEG